MERCRRQPTWVLLLCGALLACTLALSCRSSEQPSRAAGAKAPHQTTTTRATPPTTIDFAMAKKMGFSFPPATKLTSEQVKYESASCLACHNELAAETGGGVGGIHADSHDMHARNQFISCVGCHGGDGRVPVPSGLNSEQRELVKRLAHPKPAVSELWTSAANPKTVGAATLRETADYIRFVNPGDLRAARVACFNCHQDVVNNVEKSMMSHGAMLWGAALYNNGSINRKDPIFGESYSPQGVPQQVFQIPPPTTREVREQGILPSLLPLPRWEVTQPGNILRVFERGGRLRPVVGIPNVADDPGRPDVKLSIRGFGTDLRTDPVFIGLQKTRLLDPTLNFAGTNDHPGDYRGSGCTACHVVYANDRSPVHSAMWAQFGNRGQSFSADRTINPSGTTQPTTGPSVPRASGQPIKHRFVKNMPSSTCIVCHIHPGTNVVNAYLGYQWWDNETDGEFMYPKNQRYPTSDDEFAVHRKNPEGAAVRGLWSNRYPGAESHAGLRAGPNFLEELTDLNPRLKHTQFADFHGHGWVFRAVYKQDQKGTLLDAAGKPVTDVTAAKLEAGTNYTWRKPGDAPPEGTPVHLKDIHLEMGMQCADCHFAEDSHGNGNLYGETRNAVVVQCADCHGTVQQSSALLDFLKLRRAEQSAPKGQDLLRRAFTGNAASSNPDAATLQNRRRVIDAHFEERDGRLWQKSVMWEEDPAAAKEAGLPSGWTVVQTAETANPKSDWAQHWAEGAEERSRAACYAHTVRKDGVTWGDLNAEGGKDMALAHGASLSCYSCHTSWTTSCFGCHLPMRANQRKPNLHNEGAISRNYTNYNFQTLRDDIFMLGIDGTVKKNQIVPVRSACAVLVSSQNANREWLYTQQQTVSAEGFAGTAFSPYFPHTTRAVETKQCRDCHVSADGDNNATMAQLLLQGTNAVNFIGRFAWLGTGKGGITAVAVTERDEPQAVIGSRLHELAYPDFARSHEARGRKLLEAYTHHGTVLDVQLRGEYLYAACGPDGFVAYDVANIDNKGFSERIVTAPVSPLGQRLFVRTKYATSVCSPSTMAIDPTRPHLKVAVEGPDGSKKVIEPNEEQSIHPLYAYLYVTDKYEGLVVIGNPPGEKRNKPGIATLLDGDPLNNFLSRAPLYSGGRRSASFNPDGLLSGARHMALHGTHAYISCDAGVVVLDLDNPLRPRHVTTLGPDSGIRDPRKISFQFRYGFVCDAAGVITIDITSAGQPRVVEESRVNIADARDIYLSRTYGYVAAGAQGLLILDLARAEKPALDQAYDADGTLNDARAVRVGMTNSSMFCYVADGKNGLKVLQLTSANDTPGYFGYSPRPAPRLIAVYPTHHPAVALSEGLDRDRAVDEAGNQLAVFGRRGSRPFNLAEQQRLYLRTRPDGTREVYTVQNHPTTAPLAPTTAPAAPAETKPPATRPTRRLPIRR
ncbi:MAG TPA: hypothetical protein VGR35_21010 [Tepidisphaeraceae bacterium]|nr:hypothetical protein [Tepidisphaeraceae bacterium]